MWSIITAKQWQRLEVMYLVILPYRSNWSGKQVSKRLLNEAAILKPNKRKSTKDAVKRERKFQSSQRSKLKEKECLAD